MGGTQATSNRSVGKAHGRLTGVVHAGLAAALIVAVLAVAYGSAAPSLAVAEFSPTARQAMDAPPTTSGPEGGSAAARDRRRSTTTTSLAVAATTGGAPESTTAPTQRVARARQCFGTPPRQAEDLMAPACLPGIFEGDNGGATSAGVTATEIRVAVPVTSGFANDKSQRQALEGLFEYANRRFELYGRRLVPVLVEGSAVDAVTNRALGAAIGQAGVFAAVTGPLEMLNEQIGVPQVGFAQELARQHVVTVAHNKGSWWSDRQVFDAYHPFLWSAYPSAEQLQAQLGAVACALDGKPALHTVDPDILGHDRKFGIFVAGRQAPPSASILTHALEACVGEPVARLEWADLNGGGSDALRSGFARLAAQGVTTIVCACERWYIDNAVGAAHPQGFDPEYVYPTTNYGSGDEFVAQYESTYNQVASIQVQSGPRLVNLQERPWFGALLATAPTLLSSGVANLQSAFRVAEFTYDQLLILGAGIQSAGPALTPETFAAGLMSTQFPNPGAGQPPAWQPSVGFGPGDHSFYDDFAVAWWSKTAPVLGPYTFPSTTGSWCYVGAGQRFRPTTVPSNLAQLLFDETLPCR